MFGFAGSGALVGARGMVCYKEQGRKPRKDVFHVHVSMQGFDPPRTLDAVFRQRTKSLEALYQGEASLRFLIRPWKSSLAG